MSRLCILAPWYLYSGSHPARDNQCWHCVSKLCPCCCLGQQSSKKRRPNLGIGPDQPWSFFHPSENHVCPGQSCICCLALYFHNFHSFSLPLSSFYVAAENNEGHYALGPFVARSSSDRSSLHYNAPHKFQQPLPYSDHCHSITTVTPDNFYRINSTQCNSCKSENSRNLSESTHLPRCPDFHYTF